MDNIPWIHDPAIYCCRSSFHDSMPTNRCVSHFYAMYRCFPYSCTPCKPDSQLKIDPTPTPPTPSVCVVKLRTSRGLHCTHVETARARSDDPTPYPRYSTKCMGAHTKCMGPHTFCMEQPVHAWCAQYCTVMRAFSHFHAIYRCFPYSCIPCKPDSQLKIDPTPTPPTPIMCVVNLRIETPMLSSTFRVRLLVCYTGIVKL